MGRGGGDATAFRHMGLNIFPIFIATDKKEKLQGQR